MEQKYHRLSGVSCGRLPHIQAQRNTSNLSRILKLRFAYGNRRRAICAGEVAIHVNECTWFPYGDLRRGLRSKFPAIFAGDSCLLLTVLYYNE